MTKYPQDSDVWLLIADDIRQETGNKLAILGYFAGDDILIEGDSALLGCLAFLFVVRGGEGYVEWSMIITPPSGIPIVESPKTSIQLELGKPFAQAIKLFAYTLSLGTYKIEITIDDRIYHRSFAVKRAVPA